MKTDIKQYKNGITLLVTTMQGFESVAFNIFVKTGSINETEGYYGISHFIEHMLFKGTKTRTSYQISKQLDDIGANVNAFTDTEETTYFTKSTNENLEKCVEILADMFFNSVFDKKEMAREKKVVCEEISMYNDDAPSQSELLVNQLVYSGTNYAKDVAGSKKSVRMLNKQKINEYMQKFYVPQNIVISFCGNITLSQAEKLMEKYFLSHYNLSLKDEIAPLKFMSPKPLETKIDSRTIKSYKNNEQAHICVSYKGLDRFNQDRYALFVLMNALAGGMSSKLFQRIREKLGLVYSISSEETCNHAGGDVTIKFATTTNNAPLALKAIREEIEQSIRQGLTQEQFLSAKNNLIATLKLSYENTSAVNVSVCKNFYYYGRIISMQERIDKIEQVTLLDVNKVMKQIFDTTNYFISYVGKNTKIDLLKNYQSNID